MQITWISGWGVAPESLRGLAAQFAPQASHTFLPPSATSVDAARQSDCAIGWSFGAWRILEAASRGLHFEGQVILLAPFLAFCSEYGLGGCCSVTQVTWLQRWLKRESGAALQDFYQRAGLGDAPASLPYALDDMLEGLDRLAEDAPPALRDFAAKGLPANWQALIGKNDLLLDAAAVARTLPGCEVVAGAGHRPEPLLATATGIPVRRSGSASSAVILPHQGSHAL